MQKRKTTSGGTKFIGCSVKDLPESEWAAAAKTACEQNPANRPNSARAPGLLAALAVVPVNLAVLTSKYWGKEGVNLGVGFMDSPTQALRKKILAYMNLWGNYANVTFYETATDPKVRVSRGGGGYWSYLGTDILHIPAGQPTMNLEGFTERTPESEFNRVVTHETGHTLGFPHEHMRAGIIADLDVEKTIAYFQQTQGWDRSEVIAQVLTPLPEDKFLAATKTAEPDSVMCYRLPGSITKSGKAVIGGSGITASDGALAGQVYPKAGVQPPVQPAAGDPLVIKVWNPDKVEIPGYKVTKLPAGKATRRKAA